MSTQIAVRLPDDVVTYLDEQVRSGRARSRAELIARLIAREQRRERALVDLATVVALEQRDDLRDAVQVASRTPLDVD